MEIGRVKQRERDRGRGREGVEKPRRGRDEALWLTNGVRETSEEEKEGGMTEKRRREKETEREREQKSEK